MIKPVEKQDGAGVDEHTIEKVARGFWDYNARVVNSMERDANKETTNFLPWERISEENRMMFRQMALQMLNGEFKR